MRRLLAVFVAVLLATGMFPRPAVALVCRITGQEMVPVIASPENTSCCAVAVASSLSGTVQLYLSNQGCCDLIIGTERELPVAALTVLGIVPFVLPPAPPDVPRVVWSAVSHSRLTFRADVPRPPPPAFLAPRGPPSSS